MELSLQTGPSAPAVEGDNAIYSTTNEGVQTSAASGAGSVEDRKKAAEDLMLAVKRADVEVITQLIQNGANVNAVDSPGRTALMISTEDTYDSEIARDNLYQAV